LDSRQRRTLGSLLVLHDYLHRLAGMRREAVHDPGDFGMKLASRSGLSSADMILLSEHHSGEKKDRKSETLSPGRTMARVAFCGFCGTLLFCHLWHALFEKGDYVRQM